MHNIFVAVSNLFFSPSIFSIGWLPSAIYLKLNWKLVFSVDFVIRMVFNAQPNAKQFNLIVLDFFLCICVIFVIWDLSGWEKSVPHGCICKAVNSTALHVMLYRRVIKVLCSLSPTPSSRLFFGSLLGTPRERKHAKCARNGVRASCRTTFEFRQWKIEFR